MDPISDMLIRLKNAQKAGHETALVSYSKFKHEVAKTLEKEGLLTKVERRGKKFKRFLEMGLNMQGTSMAVTAIKLISKPSRRIYAGYQEIAKQRTQRAVLIVSTSKGVMSGKEAVRAKLGGQLIAEIW